MPFGTATVVTTIGKAILADRVRTSPATYTTSPKHVAMGVGATGAARTAAVGDTALSTQVESRTSGTEGSSTNTYTDSGTVTATTARVVDEAGLFDAASGGNMFTSATFPVINLATNDSITFSWTITIS